MHLLIESKGKKNSEEKIKQIEPVNPCPNFNISYKSEAHGTVFLATDEEKEAINEISREQNKVDELTKELKKMQSPHPTYPLYKKCTKKIGKMPSKKAIEYMQTTVCALFPSFSQFSEERTCFYCKENIKNGYCRLVSARHESNAIPASCKPAAPDNQYSAPGFGATMDTSKYNGDPDALFCAMMSSDNGIITGLDELHKQSFCTTTLTIEEISHPYCWYEKKMDMDTCHWNGEEATQEVTAGFKRLVRDLIIGEAKYQDKRAAEKEKLSKKPENVTITLNTPILSANYNKIILPGESVKLPLTKKTDEDSSSQSDSEITCFLTPTHPIDGMEGSSPASNARQANKETKRDAEKQPLMTVVDVHESQ